MDHEDQPLDFSQKKSPTPIATIVPSNVINSSNGIFDSLDLRTWSTKSSRDHHHLTTPSPSPPEHIISPQDLFQRLSDSIFNKAANVAKLSALHQVNKKHLQQQATLRHDESEGHSSLLTPPSHYSEPISPRPPRSSAVMQEEEDDKASNGRHSGDGSKSPLGELSARKRGRPVAPDLKDEAYWERRRKNNEAAKRSRDARRSKETEIALRAAFLEQENLMLRVEVQALKSETAKLRSYLYQNN